MQHTKGIILVDIKLRFALMLIVLAMALSGCSQKPNPDVGSVSKDTLSAPLPDTLRALAVDATTLVVEVIVDGGTPQACTNLSVDQENSTYSCDITLSTGPHILSLVYSIRDNTDGTPLQVTTTSDVNVDIIAGQTASADFSSATLTYDDNDRDGINNLIELTEGSNPSEPSYYVGGTVSGLVGGGSTIQLNVNGELNGGSALSLSGDDNFIIRPAVANNSTYAVTVLTQPNTPSQTCTITNGSGTVSNVEVTNVTIQCVNDNLPGSVPTASDVSIIDDNGGDAVVGESLTGNYSYNDADGDIEGTSTFRWLRNGVAITGAAASTYTLVAADAVTQITFEVTPVAVTGTTTGSAVTSSGIPVINIPVVNSAPTASDVSITDDNGGNTLVGDSLTGSYTYNDVEGDTEGVSTFRWLRNGTAIGGATSSLYTLAAADSDQTITFEVTPVAVTGTTTGSAVISSGIPVTNSAPTASDVSIIDDNGGDAVVGESLTGNYSYNDADGDIEGTSTFRWLRNGVAITGAAASTYTLVAADVPTQITFEVTPVATTGNVTGSAITSTALATGTAPVVSGFARYLDINMNGVNDANDQLIIPFDQNVSVNAVDISHFNLPVTGDTFGTGATVAAGPASNEVTITLGVSPNFKTRQDFSNIVTVVNSASGIDVAALIVGGVIEGASGIDAVPSVPIDLIPAYVDSLQSLGANDSSTSVALGDVDGDGDLDMVVTNFDQANRVYTNDGAGGFTDSVQVLDANNSNFVALGDVDGDGDLDMVVANSNQANLVYTNDGAGSFTDSGQVLGTNVSTSVALGDVDGDGDLDMVVTNFDQANRVYTNNGAGSFTDSGQALGANRSEFVALGDVDGDGDLDMVVANSIPTTQANRVYINDGTGSFTDSGQALGTNDSRSVALGDVDGDGDLDMVVANASNLNNLADRVYINDGVGNFIDSGQLLDTNGSSSVVLGDVDGDGDLDMLVASVNRVYTNDGAGSFTDSGQVLGSNSSSSVALGDVDGDGDLDMVATDARTANRVYLNSLTGTWGTASFTDSDQALGTNTSTSVVLGDVDSDGDLDMVVANSTPTQANRVYTNDGAGSFTDSGQALGKQDSTFITLGDIDGDGDLDMVVANNVGQANRVYTNDGTGSFTDSGQFLGANDNRSVVLGDVDGDGDLDIIVANRSGQANRLYTNDGAGNFTDSGQAFGTNTSESVALGDVDGDGDLDMVVGNSTNNPANRVYTNDGAGIFTDSGQVLVTNSSLSVALSDVDGDGDLDMVVADGFGDQANRVYTNDGSGRFTDSGQVLGTNNSFSIALGDVDGDGDLDMVVANVGTNRVYLNQ